MTTHLLISKLGINAESDAMNASMQRAIEQGNPASVAAVVIYQRWIDGEIESWNVPELLTDPNDLAIFKAAEYLWMELAGSGVILDVGDFKSEE